MRGRFLTVFVACLVAVSLSPLTVGRAAQSGADSADLWQEIPATSLRSPGAPGASHLRIDRYVALTLDRSGMASALAAAPLEFTESARTRPVVLSLPTPKGDFARFAIRRSPVVAPRLAARYPQIQTYSGQGIDNPAATVRLDLGLTGFHAQVLSNRGAWYIDPYFHLDDSQYVSYFKRHLRNSGGPFVEPDIERVATDASKASPPQAQPRSAGAQLHTYRLAVAGSGEYSAFHGGTVPLTHNAIVTAVNRLTGIYETELSVRFQLVANNDSLIYTNAATDPYSNDNPGALLDENQANIDTVVGTSNYDIGHVFTTGGGGLAGLGVVGVTGQKAWGETGSSSPTGDAFWVDYVAHEIGHQFGGNHTFNGVNGSCAGNGAGNANMEPGSGTTIQAYAGICGLDDLQNRFPGASSDPYFHAKSFDEMQAVIANPGQTGAVTATTNSVPTVSVTGGPFTIPARTPFALSATGSDGNPADALTYSWEQYDNGGFRALTNASKSDGALFRSLPPTTSPTRVFPKPASILSNNTNANTGSCPALPGGLDCWSEFLPTSARTMKFRVTVRDNRVGGGGVNIADTTVTVANSAPFLVTSPNTAVTLGGGSSQAVTWNTAGTNAAPVNTTSVDILLSTDGGVTFPTVLASATANDGSQQVTLPNVATNQARVKVVPVGNIYFDMSDVSFTITQDTSPPANDSFVNAIALSGTAAARVGDSNVNATKEIGEPDHAGDVGGASVWYSWTAPQTGQVSISTAGSSFDTLLGVYAGGSVGGLTEIAANDDEEPGLLSSKVSFIAQAGSTYRLAVDGFNNATGSVNIGLSQNDCTVVGTSRNDRLVGTGSNDVLCGLGGNDTILPRAGADTVRGGQGKDTVSYDGLGAGVTVDLASGTTGGAAGSDSLSTIERAIGTAFGDSLAGDAKANRFSGLGGPDTILGRGGADTLNGGAGTDTLNGGTGTDTCLRGESKTSCEL